MLSAVRESSPKLSRQLQRQIFLHTVLSLLTAVLLLVLFPNFDVRMLAPIALTPLLFVLGRTEQGWLRFAYGWAAGIFYWFFLCTWIQFVLEVHGGMGRWGGWGCFVLFALLKGLHLAVFSWLAGPFLGRGWAVPAIAALWTGLERTHATFGFAWLDLGNAGIDMSVPLRLAPFVGVYGVSFVFSMLAAGLACVLLKQPRNRLFPLASLGLLPFLPAIPEGMPQTERALMVQPNIDPSTEWTGALQVSTERQLTTLSNALAAPLVIWPELPAPLYYYNDSEFRQIAGEIAKRHGYFLFGTVAYNSEKQPLNSALLLGPSGNVAGRYDKIDLVPFGEFIPPLFGFVNRITQEAGDFAPGQDISILSAGNQRMGVFICYESAFPDLVRQFTKMGANVLVNLSNDSYFGRSSARRQHLLLARMRAIENRRFIVRSTNDGLSAIIDPAGRIVKQLPAFEAVAAPIRYSTVGAVTFYARHGDWFAWGCLATGVGLAGFEFWKRGRLGRQNANIY